jgi:murein DD-endopeptidase MepM/ murein hydrolase activator NlpD
MSRLTLLTSLLALTLAGGGAGGLAMSQTRIEPALKPQQEALAVQPVPKVKPSTQRSPDKRFHLRPGESLAEALLRSGVGSLDSILAEQSLADHALAAGRPVRLWLGATLPGGARTLDRLEAQASDGDLVHLLKRKGDTFTFSSEKLAIDDTPVRLRLVVGPRLVDGLKSAGLPTEARTSILSLVGKAEEGRVDIIIAHEEIAGDRHYGPILYLALSRSSGESQRWLGDEQGQLTPVGVQTLAPGLQRPVAGAVSSTVGMRFHPVLRFFRWHRGTDFAAPAGMPVQAAAAGRVIDAGWRGGYGKLVRLAHADGTVTAYAHLSRIDAGVGEHVPRGAIIGLVGATGLATGPHLHFEWLRDGRALEPDFAPLHAGTATLDAPTRLALMSLLAAPFRTPPALGS